MATKKKQSKAPAEKAKPAAQDAADKRLSALDAAARVLTEGRQPMTCPELIQAMASKGYWSSPAGKTPAATLHAAIAREIKTKKEQARFKKTKRRKFTSA
jgi:hypothetical protein